MRIISVTTNKSYWLGEREREISFWTTFLNAHSVRLLSARFTEITMIKKKKEDF